MQGFSGITKRAVPGSASKVTGSQARSQRIAASTDRSDTATEPTTSSGLKNIGPTPQRFTVAAGQLKNVASAAFPFIARLGSGGFNAGYSVSLVPDDGKYGVLKFAGRKVAETSAVSGFARPAQPLVLYEFEGCPFCRKVREAVSILDLDVLFRPCPKDGPTWRPQAIQKGGKKQFPYLEDPNTGVAMYESDAIVSYLFEKYGDNKVPLPLRLGTLTTVTAAMALAPRAGRGNRYRGSVAKAPQQPLVLWGYELSPFVKIVKEVLCELELAHVQRTCARGSPKRQELLDRAGHFQVPYLEDPNQGVCLFESAAIIEYLEKKYGA